MNINNDKNYWVYSGSCYLVEFVLPGWMINEIAQPGSNDAAVELNAKSDIVQKGVANYSDDELRKTYNEVCYVDNNPSASRQEMIEYILWDACWNAADERDLLEEGER